VGFYRRKMEDQRATAAEKESSIASAGPVAIPEVSVSGHRVARRGSTVGAAQGSAPCRGQCWPIYLL
jgi:hypothetical protein